MPAGPSEFGRKLGVAEPSSASAVAPAFRGPCWGRVDPGRLRPNAEHVGERFFDERLSPAPTMKVMSPIGPALIGSTKASLTWSENALAGFLGHEPDHTVAHMQRSKANSVA
jgi:hypothetical protein